MSDFSPKRIQLVYTLCLVTAFFALVYFFIGFSINFKTLSLFHLSTVFIFIFCAFIVEKRKLNTSRILYFITFDISVTVTASYIGKPGSVEFLLLFAFALPFLIFSFRREKNLLQFFLHLL